jgi:hypothetical protein
MILLLCVLKEIGVVVLSLVKELVVLEFGLVMGLIYALEQVEQVLALVHK